MKKDYKIIVLDLDGTLTNSNKEISIRNKKALIKAQQAGILVVLASGRPTYGIIPLAKELELDQYGGYILSYNGGQIIDVAQNESIYHKVLPNHVIPAIYNLVTKHQATLLSYEGEYIITENSTDPYVAIESHLNRMRIKTVDSFCVAIQNPVTKCLAVGEPSKLIELEKELKANYSDILNIYRSEPFFLELVPPHIDKAYSLNRLVEHLQLTREDMIAFGDGFNDLSMIEYAGMGVAMANAQDAVKAIANKITLSNNEDGVAHILEQLPFYLN